MGTAITILSTVLFVFLPVFWLAFCFLAWDEISTRYRGYKLRNTAFQIMMIEGELNAAEEHFISTWEDDYYTLNTIISGFFTKNGYLYQK